MISLFSKKNEIASVDYSKGLEKFYDR